MKRGCEVGGSWVSASEFYLSYDMHDEFGNDD